MCSFGLIRSRYKILVKDTKKTRTKNSARENIDLFTQKKSEADPYYRIEKLPKEDKGKKEKKNLFLNDSLKGSSFQATIKK